MTNLDKELQRMLLIRDISLKTAEESRGNIRDFFLSQTLRIENEILVKYGLKIKGSKHPCHSKCGHKKCNTDLSRLTNKLNSKKKQRKKK